MECKKGVSGVQLAAIFCGSRAGYPHHVLDMKLSILCTERTIKTEQSYLLEGLPGAHVATGTLTEHPSALPKPLQHQEENRSGIIQHRSTS